MDYSLLLVELEDRQELVIGIVDYIRQYTLDKGMETFVRASGNLVGSTDTPSVIPPEEYKQRFREVISSYFFVVPEPQAPPLLRSAATNPLPPPPSSESASLLSDDSQPEQEPVS